MRNTEREKIDLDQTDQDLTTIQKVLRTVWLLVMIGLLVAFLFLLAYCAAKDKPAQPDTKRDFAPPCEWCTY